MQYVLNRKATGFEGVAGLSYGIMLLELRGRFLAINMVVIPWFVFLSNILEGIGINGGNKLIAVIAVGYFSKYKK